MRLFVPDRGNQAGEEGLKRAAISYLKQFTDLRLLV